MGLKVYEDQAIGTNMNIYILSRWWFHIVLYFHPDPWGNDPI